MRTIWLGSHIPLPRFEEQAKSLKGWEKLADWQNEEQFEDLYMYYTNLWIDLFKWEGLPDTCDERIIETYLFFYGKVVFFDRDNMGDYRHLPVMFGPQFTLYGEPKNLTAFSFDATWELTNENSVVIRNNYQMWPSYMTVATFCNRLVKASRSIDIASMNLRQPVVYVGNETEVESFLKFHHSWNKGEPAMIATKALNIDGVKVYPLPANQGSALTSLWDHFNSLTNQFNTRLGKNNTNTDKKERLITDEAEANNQIVDDSLNLMLNARKQACEKINEMFGLDISVSVKNVSHETTAGGEQDGVVSDATGGANG